MKRNRIVINLDQNQTRGGHRIGSRGGVGRVLLIIAVVLLVVIGGLAAGGYFWWRHYQSGPAYSLALLADAAQRNDRVTADSVLDTEKISADFVSQVAQKMPNSGALSSQWLTFPQLEASRSSISTKLKETVHEQLMRELKELTDVAAGKPFIIVALAVPYFADIKQDNNTAQVTVNIKDEQIKLTMQSAGERWRISAVQDEKLAKMIADSLIHSMPTNGPQLQDSIQRQLDKVQNR